MLVLSITILAAALITSTVLHNGSVAGIIQAKTSQHAATSMTSTHIVSSAAHGSVNVQPKTNQHPVTTIRGPHMVSGPRGGVAMCHTPSQVSEAGPIPSADIDCDTKITSVKVGYVPHRAHPWVFSGSLLANTDCCSLIPIYTWYPVQGATITLQILAKDGHFEFKNDGTTNSEGEFGLEVDFCDKQQQGDHSFYYTANFNGGTARANGNMYAVEKSISPRGLYKPAADEYIVCGQTPQPPKFPTRFSSMAFTNTGTAWRLAGKLEANITKIAKITGLHKVGEPPTAVGFGPAPVTLEMLAKDGHFDKKFDISTDGTGLFPTTTISFCDKQQQGDHSFYYTAYFNGGAYRVGDFGTYMLEPSSSKGSSSSGPWQARVCAAGSAQTNAR